MTSLEDLKKLTDSSLLIKEDWILLKYIATTEQNSFRPCVCLNPNKHGSILFTKDSLKTYSNPKHSAHGLGPVYNRFKCSAVGCNNSFAPVTMLIKYKEAQEAPLINPQTKKRLHSQKDEGSTSNREPKAFLWRDVVDDIEMSQPVPLNSQLNTQLQDTYPTIIATIASHPTMTITSDSHHTTTGNSRHTTISNATGNSHHTSTGNSHHGTTAVSKPSNTISTTDSVNSTATPSNDISSKLDNLTAIIISLKTDSDSKMDFLLNSFDTLMSKNQDLEQRLANLSARLLVTEDKLTQIGGMQSTEHAHRTTPTSSTTTSTRPSINSTTYSNMPQANNAITPQSSTSTTTWASIARANPKDVPRLARAKAQENIQINDRAKLISQLSRVAKPRIIPDTNKNHSKSVYVAGFDFIKIREIWKALAEARFQVSRIINIQWIGKSVLDIVVYDDYHLQFISELTLNRQFRLLTFNPSCNSKASTPAQNETAMRAFAVRCIKNITNPLNSPTCINHFKTISKDYCNRNPDLSKIFSQEWERIKSTISAQPPDSRQNVQSSAELSTNGSLTIDSTTINVSTTNHDPNTGTSVTIDSTNHDSSSTTKNQTTNSTTHNSNNNISMTANLNYCDSTNDISANIDIVMEDESFEPSNTTADSTVEYGSGAH